MSSYALKALIKIIIKGMISLAHMILGIEGVNLILLVAPAGLIVPILRKYGAVIGNKSHIGRIVFLDLKDQIVIGERVTISMRAT